MFSATTTITTTWTPIWTWMVVPFRGSRGMQWKKGRWRSSSLIPLYWNTFLMRITWMTFMGLGVNAKGNKLLTRWLSICSKYWFQEFRWIGRKMWGGCDTRVVAILAIYFPRESTKFWVPIKKSNAVLCTQSNKVLSRQRFLKNSDCCSFHIFSVPDTCYIKWH